MKEIKLFFFLVLFSTICSQIIEIENGQIVEIFLEGQSSSTVTYNFIVPESDIYEQVFLIYRLEFDKDIYFKIYEDDDMKIYGTYKSGFYYYSLSSIKNQTITFTFQFYSTYGKFTLLDLTKEINTTLENLINIVPTSIIGLNFDPLFKMSFNIDEVISDKTYFFQNTGVEGSDYIPFGNGYIEYCYDDNCLNNIYNSSKVIEFKKGSKYKIKINYIKIENYDIYIYTSYDIIKYTEAKKLNKGGLVYNIDKSNIEHFFILDGKDINKFRLYSKCDIYFQYTTTTEDLINNLPFSLEEMEFHWLSLYYDYDINSDNYAIIILKDDEKYDKNLIYIFDKLYDFKTSFETFTLNKGTFSFIRYNDRLYNNFFISIESNKPSLKKITDIDSFERDEIFTQILNQKFVCAFNEDDDVIIKIRFYDYKLKKIFNNITSINNYKLNDYLDEYGNSESLFLRWRSNNLNYYGFATLLVFDLESEYYLYFKKYYGNINVYISQIDDNTNLKSFLGIIESYEDIDNFTLINDKLIVINGSQLFSAFLNYGFFGDIFIQKANDNQNIKLNNNDITGNLVKLLISDKKYTLDFNLNHIIKLDKDFSDATVIFYDNNDNEIGLLDINNKIIELNGENITAKSNKNALIYFYSIIPNKKKLYEIIFDKGKIGKNMNITITNIKSDNESIIFIKDYGFENHYPMLSANNWDKILIEKNKTTSIFIENPYDKLEKNELVDNETFIIYIANAYDENGIPYFEEDKFEIVEINYKKNSYSKYNKFDFQVIEMDEESSFILSQSNKNTINYQMALCNDNSDSYHFIIDYSNSNISNKDNIVNSDLTYSDNIQNNEIMSHSFYMESDNQSSLFFYYNFDNNMNSNLFTFSSEYDNTIEYVKALDEKHLEIKFRTYSSNFFKFYIIVALVDDNNNISTFNQYCYLTKLITDNINSNYILKIIYEYPYYYDNPKYIIAKIDISNLKADINSKFVMSMLNENLSRKRLDFNSALEFIPDKPKEIDFYNFYEFDVKKNYYFVFNYTDSKVTEFLLDIKYTYPYDSLIIYIEGPDTNLKYSESGELINIVFNLTKPGLIYITFTYDDEKDDKNGLFLVYPIQKIINIIDFKEKIYFSHYTLETKKNTIIFIYNVTNLTEDKLVYFTCLQKQFKVCEISSQRCIFVNRFYKFLANKEYFIYVYSYDEISYYRSYMMPYVFGVFNQENIKLYNDLGVDKNNEPRLYLVEKQYVDSFYFINITSNLSFSAQVDYKTDEIFNQLENINFDIISSNYTNFNLNKKLEIILVFPNFNYELKSYDNLVIICSNKLYINKGENEEIILPSGENAIIIIEKEENNNDKVLKYYYNNLRIVTSPSNNLGLVDYNNSYDKLSDSLILNSKDNYSNYIYIDKSQINNTVTVQFSYYEPRYSYFYALDDISLKNKTKIMKEKGYNSYFKRDNSEIGVFYDLFNKMTFDLEDKVNIYFKKYYGNSNIYEVNLEIYNINDLSFLTKPIKTYETEKSILNQLFGLESKQLYSGFLDYQTLYDIYIDIDNGDNIVKMQKEDNPFNNLMKLFKPNINYIIDFEVNHLIKLDPNFNAEVTIIDSERTIKLNKNNPTTTEIKGNNVQITVNSSAILYFYNSISSFTSTSDIYKNIFQFEIEPKNEKNLYLDIDIMDEYQNWGNFHYLIDVGFEGYTPFESQGFYGYLPCSEHCYINFPNYYDKLKGELVEGEKLFIYYYMESNKFIISTNLTSTYYSSLKNINNYHSFFVIPPNIEGEEEKNLIINFYNKYKLGFQAHYCPNNDGSKPILNYHRRGDYYYSSRELEDSKLYFIEYRYKTEETYKFNFTSKNEFVFSYFFFDKYDIIINSTSNWRNEREINQNLNIKKAEIYFYNKTANVQFIPNYIKSSTKYFIIIAPKNDTFDLDSFNNPCFLIKLITENSNGVKIYETMSIGDEDIDVNIDISDLIALNLKGKNYIVNVVSLELRFDKKLNFYEARLFEIKNQIYINEDISFDGKDLYYDLGYSRPNKVGELCIFISKLNSSECEVLLTTPNIEEESFRLYHGNKYTPFECHSEGYYSINIHTLSEEAVQGSFKIISTGIPFDLDLSYYYDFSVNPEINFQPSPLIFNIDASKLGKDSLIQFAYDNFEIFIQDDNSNNMTFNNEFFFFKKEKIYQINVKFNKPDEKILYYFELKPYLDYIFEELSLGTRTYNKIDYTFLKISYKNTPKIIFETEKNKARFLISNISESNYNIFPEKIQELEFKEITDLKTVKPNDFDYAILLIYFNYSGENTQIEFIDGREHLDIELDNTYNIVDIFTVYDLNFDSNKDNEILILFYNFDKKYSGDISIKSDGFNYKAEIKNKLNGRIYFEVPTRKKYEIYFNNLEEKSGNFTIISTGNLFKVNINQELIYFEEMFSQKETSPLIFTFGLLDKDCIIKIDINNEDPSKIISIKNDDETFINSVNNYYIFEKDTNYIVQINPIREQELYKFEKVNIQRIGENNIQNLKMGKITFTDKIDKFIKINYTEISSFEIINDVGKPQYTIANLNESEYIDFPKNIKTIKFNKLDNNNIKKHANIFYSILIIYLNNDKTELSFNQKIGPSYIDFNSNYIINKDQNSFLINYENPLNNDELVIINYDFNEKNSVKVFIERPHLENEIITINKKQKGYFYFNVKDNGELMITFEEIMSNNNNGESLSGEFNILLTGKEFTIDIDQNIIEFDEIKSSIQPSPLTFTFGLLNKDYIKQLNIENDDPSKFVLIKKNEDKYMPINNFNNYYTFEKSNKYSIQLNFQKVDDNFILNEVKFIEFSENNIEFLNESNIKIYNETNIDKFILFNFNNFSKLKVNQTKGSSIFNKAIINETQYNIFPIEIQNIEFEEIENNIFEIKKQKNSNFGVLKISLNEKNTEIEFKFENDKDNNKSKNKSKLSTFGIIMIVISCFIFLVIVGVVILIILRKRRNSRNTEAKFKSLKKELVEMSGNDEEQPKEN